MRSVRRAGSTSLALTVGNFPICLLTQYAFREILTALGLTPLRGGMFLL